MVDLIRIVKTHPWRSAAAVAATGVAGFLVVRTVRRAKDKIAVVTPVGQIDTPEGAPGPAPKKPTTVGPEGPEAIWPWQSRSVSYSGEFTSVEKNTPAFDIPNVPMPPGVGGPVATGIAAAVSHLNNTFENLVRSLQKMAGTSSPGEYRLLATKTVPGAYVEGSVTWGRQKGDVQRQACARMAWRGARADSGPIPEILYDPDPYAGQKPLHPDKGEILHYCRTGVPDFYGSWIKPVGPQRPQMSVVVQGSTTGLVLWLPGRGDSWWYDVKWRWRKLQ